MLYTAPWMEYFKTPLFTHLKLSLEGDMKILFGHYFFGSKDYKKMTAFIEDKIDDKTWRDSLFSFFEKERKELLMWEEKDDIVGFYKSMIPVMGCSTFIEICDKVIEREILTLCEDKNVQFSTVIGSMELPRKTETMLFEETASRVNGKARELFVEKNRWIGTHALEGAPLTEEKVNLRKQKETIEKKVELPQFEHLITIGSHLAFYRLYLVEATDRVAFHYRQALTDLGKRKDASYEDVISLTPEELFAVVKGSPYPPLAKARKKYFGIIQIDGKRSILLGGDLKKELQACGLLETYSQDEVRGISAFPGKIKGKARIIKESHEIDKVMVGDILFAAETTPDFIFAMKKAAAFVTNHGGITSHAAILSRELKKPCIIATKIGTEVFKDGDMVEVDADAGVVRKVNG